MPDRYDAASMLERQPGYQAALQRVEAERSVRRQLRQGAGEWTVSSELARVRSSGAAPGDSKDWSLALERPVRWPGKSEVQARAGEARVALSQAQLALAWRTAVRQFVADLLAWRRADASAALWVVQRDALGLQRDAVARRQRLGDAARLEQEQANVAWEQARAQADQTAALAAAAKAQLMRRYPGLDLMPAGAGDTAGPISTVDAEIWREDARRRSTEVGLAAAEAAVLAAQAEVERAERRPDPTVGVRYGRAAYGQEQTVALTFSVPFGGDYRRAGADAAAARATEAALLLAEIESRWAAEAERRWLEARALSAMVARQRENADRLEAIAVRLARGYELGEGSLNDVLIARRAAGEQRLAATSAGIDELQMRAQMLVDIDALWAPPERPAPKRP
ncbi:MAG: TolC family protein [Pseudomonadota bacterium]